LQNAKLLSATTSFLLRHTNSSKNHGYNAVEDDLRRQPFRAEDSAFAPDEKGQKSRKSQTYCICTEGPYIPYSLFQTKGEMCAKFGSEWIRSVNLYKVQTNKQTNKQTNIQFYI